MQTFTSANTSINKGKVPAVFTKAWWKKGTVNLDLGGGKYDTATEYLHAREVANLVWDPYNRSEAENLSVMCILASRGGADSCTISNVLNVIDSAEARHELLNRAWDCTRYRAPIFITVYEGDRSGVGRQTGKDQWQNNRPLRDYLDEVKAVFPNATILKGMIVANHQNW